MRAGLLGWYGPQCRPWSETLLLLGILGLTAEESVFQWLHASGPMRVPGTVVAGLAALSLVLARRYPVVSAVLPVVTGGLLNRALPGLLSVYHLSYLGRPGAAMLGGAVIAVLSAIGADSVIGWAGTTGSQLLVQAATLSFGLWLHGRRVLIRTLHEQVDVLRRERELRAEQARAAERARIAREMHDVLAHRLSLLVLHAGVLGDQARAGTVAADQDRLTHRLELLRTTAARSLDDLRDVLGALRAHPPAAPDGEAGPAVPSGGPSVPAPALRDLTELVGEATQAGQRVELALSGDPEAVPTTHRLAVHRLVQEALTNARKYAHAASVTVRVAYGAPATTVEVRNGPGEILPDGSGGGGYGLVGLNERVGALGGHLDAGPDGAGGFRLSARLPAPERPPPVPGRTGGADGGGAGAPGPRPCASQRLSPSTSPRPFARPAPRPHPEESA
ncbi:sensor histidine kinase [Streptomyces sp. NRRL WC-3742]|uniref:sensor histidine kinase n=1 Tax=Streptomyces sp. NRRL WC-3742 TaxID=1463934 RepID=UPI001F3F80C4|nr:histidine kinase [Streptomyces sp. NRRL WC-3742]